MYTCRSSSRLWGEEAERPARALSSAALLTNGRSFLSSIVRRRELLSSLVTITARPAIFMPAVTKLPDIIPSHWVRKAQIKPILYWMIFLERGGEEREICSSWDKKPGRLRYEIRKELHIPKSCSQFSAFGINVLILFGLIDFVCVSMFCSTVILNGLKDCL